MTYQFKQVAESEYSKFDELNKAINASTFLTSIDWILFQKSLGKEIELFFIEKDSKNIGVLYIEIFRRKITKFAYAPYNPVLDYSSMSAKEILEFMKDFASFSQNLIKQKGLKLFRFDPFLNLKQKNILKAAGFTEALAPAQAKDMWQIDLTQSAEEIRSGMSKSTRYNINKGERSGMTFVRASSESEVKAFADLMKETTNRKSFSNFDYSYFLKQFQSLNKKGMTDIFLIKFEDKFISGGLVNYYKDTAYYTHGCSTSDPVLAKLRSPYLLQWNIQNFCKEKGIKNYNMWGILPERVKSHSMLGVSEYKRSFGGYEINLVGAHDIYASFLDKIIQRSLDFYFYRKDRY